MSVIALNNRVKSDSDAVLLLARHCPSSKQRSMLMKWRVLMVYGIGMNLIRRL